MSNSECKNKKICLSKESSQEKIEDISNIYKNVYRGDGKRLFTNEHKPGEIVEVNGKTGEIDNIERHQITIRFPSGIDYDYDTYESNEVFPRLIKETDAFKIERQGFKDILIYTIVKSTNNYLEQRRNAKHDRESYIKKCRLELRRKQEEVENLQKSIVRNYRNIDQVKEISIKMTELLTQIHTLFLCTQVRLSLKLRKQLKKFLMLKFYLSTQCIKKEKRKDLVMLLVNKVQEK